MPPDKVVNDIGCIGTCAILVIGRIQIHACLTKCHDVVADDVERIGIQDAHGYTIAVQVAAVNHIAVEGEVAQVLHINGTIMLIAECVVADTALVFIIAGS